jgi:thioredoxin-like negative regulator of GroEL
LVVTKPAVFADLGFEAALERARVDGKRLVVDATAEWCPPCKMMDRTTWVDAAVVARLSSFAIAIQLDVDQDAETAKRLGVRAMPTLVAFYEGVEVDRVTGARQPAQLLAWLDEIERGRTALDALKAEVDAAPSDMQKRLEYARMLRGRGRFDDATREHVWLWTHMLEHQPSMLGVRLSFFISDIERLVAYPPARAEFSALRDALAPTDVASLDREAFVEWTALNRALREEERVIAWFDSVRPQLAPGSEDEHFIGGRIVWQLATAGRWADAGALLRDPAKAIAGTAEVYLKRVRHGLSPEHLEAAAAAGRQQHRRTAADMVRALTAAGRLDDARAVADMARSNDDSPEMAAALDAAARA